MPSYIATATANAAVENGFDTDAVMTADVMMAKAVQSFPLRRPGSAGDVAAAIAIAFLASDDARFISGVDLRVDGAISLQSATHWAQIET